MQVMWRNADMNIGGEKLSNIFWCAGIIIATFLLKRPLAHLLSRISAGMVNRMTHKKYGSRFRELIQRPLESLIQTILFYIAINQLGVLLNLFVMHRIKNKHEELAVSIGDVIDHIFLFLTILFTTLLLSKIIDFIYYAQFDKATEEHNKERQQLLPLIKEVAKLVLWTMGLFWVLGTVFHVNIPALITGLGIGGVAIALAAKESVENLFAAFTILSDKPFHTSDVIRLGTLEGTVERIGFRSTRLRSADGSVFIIPNQKLVNENLENLSERTDRRIKLTANIKYGLKHETLDKMVSDLKKMLPSIAPVIAPIEITLDSFGENVFQLAIVYHLPAPLPPGSSLADIKHQVNMQVYDIIYKYTGGNELTVADAPTAEAPAPEEDAKDSDDTLL